MDSLNNFIATAKTNIMKKMLNYTDAEYYLIKYKPNPDADETKFIDVYENVYIMQGVSLISMIPSLIYLLRIRKYRANFEKSLPGFTQEGLQKLSKRLILYLSFGTVLAINSQVYAYSNDLTRLMKEIGNR